MESLTASMKETNPMGRKQQSRKAIAGCSPPHLKTIWTVQHDGCPAK